MTNHTPVLIIGAGPTGLMMACELARHGVACRIIDKKPERTLSSNAVAIHARTLEVLNHIGIVKRFIDAGHVCHAAHIYDGKIPLVRIPIDSVPSKYPMILMLPQSDTERLLNERLEEFQRYVERPIQLIDVQLLTNQIEVNVQHPETGAETISCDWLIACDGANSVTREKCHIYFPGEDIPEQFVVADALMDSYVTQSEVHVFLDKGTMFGVFPLGKSKYRIAANIHQDRPRQFLIEKEVKEMLHERAQGVYNINSVSWISPFWIHGKIANHFRDGSVFVVGDAAHVHSPLGGQGMNTGLQDAYNLAWKLALVVKGKAYPALLDSYQTERYPVITKIVTRANGLTKLFLSTSFILATCRYMVCKMIEFCSPIAKKIAMEFAQLTTRYHQSSVVDYSQRVSKKSPQPGQHAPDVKLSKSHFLHDHLQHTQHTILLFAGTAMSADLTMLQKSLQQAYPELIKVYIIATQPLPGVEYVIEDLAGIIHKKYHVRGQAVYVLRPDNYIAYCSGRLESGAIKRCLSRYLLQAS